MYTSWISLVMISLWVSVAAFVWALRNGQFADQGRARYLPLSDELLLSPVTHPSKLTAGAYALLSIVILGLLGIVGSLVLSLRRWMG